MAMKEIVVGTAVSKAAGRKKGSLRIGTLPDGSAMEIPVVIVRGSKPGSVLGHFYDLHGHPNGEALAPKGGIVLAIHPGPMIGSGETLVHIGLDPREM